MARTKRFTNTDEDVRALASHPTQSYMALSEVKQVLILAARERGIPGLCSASEWSEILPKFERYFTK